MSKYFRIYSLQIGCGSWMLWFTSRRRNRVPHFRANEIRGRNLFRDSSAQKAWRFIESINVCHHRPCLCQYHPSILWFFHREWAWLFRYLNSGRSTNRPIGKNKLSKYPQDVAKFLGLDPTGYSGHCWRRTGATILAEADVSLIQLKHAGGWRSDQVCQEYVEESKNEKIKIASRLLFFEDNSQASLPARALTEQLPSINVDMSNCSGSCVFNYFTPFHQISLEKFK